jgi:hypothetical protein
MISRDFKWLPSNYNFRTASVNASKYLPVRVMI